VAIDAPEERPLLDARGGPPRLERADGADVGVRAEGDGYVGAGAELVGLRALHPHEHAAGGVDGQVGDVEGDEFRAAERAAEPHEDQGAVPQAPPLHLR
jgi:hypothetical protein